MDQFVLFGAGDWGAWADTVFAGLATAHSVALVVAAGSAENGRDAIAAATSGARARLARVGIGVSDIAVITRANADDDAAVAALDTAAFVYVLGGGPRGTIDTLVGSRLWSAMRAAKTCYVGTSGGAMLPGSVYPTVRDGSVFGAAAGVFPSTVIAPHWDELEAIASSLRDRFLTASAQGVLVCLDRNSGVVGNGVRWRAVGPGTVNVRSLDRWTAYGDGDEFDLDLEVSGSDGPRDG